MELERFAHELGDATIAVSISTPETYWERDLPPNNHFVKHATPQSSDSRTQL